MTSFYKHCLNKIFTKALLTLWCGGLLLFVAEGTYAQQNNVLETNKDYRLSLVAELERPASSFSFDFEGGFLFAQDMGGFFNIVKFNNQGQQTILERTSQPILNLGFSQGTPFVVTRGKISVVSKGKLKEIINGLPIYGDYGNGPLVFSKNEMYFSVGTATNSGVVSADNPWLSSYPSVHDQPCADLKLASLQFETENFLTAKKKDVALTFPLNAFNTPQQDLVAHGSTRCNGAIYKANLNGNVVEVFAWGFHNIKSLSVDDSGEIYALDAGMEDRGVRPVKNGRDGFYKVAKVWYGWPEFTAGEKITNESLLADFPNQPPVPTHTFELNKLKSLLVSSSDFDSNPVGLTSDNKLVLVRKSDFVTIANLGAEFKNAEIKQIKFGPDGKLYALIHNNGKSLLYAMEPVNKPIHLIPANTKDIQNYSIMSLLLLLLGGSAALVVKFRQRPV